MKPILLSISILSLFLTSCRDVEYPYEVVTIIDNQSQLVGSSYWCSAPKSYDESGVYFINRWQISLERRDRGSVQSVRPIRYDSESGEVFVYENYSFTRLNLQSLSVQDATLEVIEAFENNVLKEDINPVMISFEMDESKVPSLTPSQPEETRVAEDEESDDEEENDNDEATISSVDYEDIALVDCSSFDIDGLGGREEYRIEDALTEVAIMDSGIQIDGVSFPTQSVDISRDIVEKMWCQVKDDQLSVLDLSEFDGASYITGTSSHFDNRFPKFYSQVQEISYTLDSENNMLSFSNRSREISDVDLGLKKEEIGRVFRGRDGNHIIRLGDSSTFENTYFNCDQFAENIIFQRHEYFYSDILDRMDDIVETRKVEVDLTIAGDIIGDVISSNDINSLRYTIVREDSEELSDQRRITDEEIQLFQDEFVILD